MKRPAVVQKLPNKPKSLLKHPKQSDLAGAAEKAYFAPSPYHCPTEGHRATVRRFKPATPCPRTWSLREGLNAIREAIRNGHVSAKWNRHGFPRHVWHREGDVWYEARTVDGTPGEYHGYPIEESAVPAGLRQ